MGNRFLGEKPHFAGDRDATHVAMFSVEAKETFKAGDPIQKDGSKGGKLAIVDPFLEGEIKAGDLVWACLKPKSTNDLRHVWSHPEFEDEDPQEKEEDNIDLWKQKLAGILATLEPHFDSVDEFLDLLDGTSKQSDWGDVYTMYTCSDGEGSYLHCGGFDACGSIPPELWDCVEKITGKSYGRPTYFSCSC